MQVVLSGYDCLPIKWSGHLGARGFQRVRKECGKGDSISDNGDLQKQNVSVIRASQ